MTLLKLIVAGVYGLVGFAGFIAFVVLKNYPAAILASITGFTNIICGRIHFLNYKNRLMENYSADQLYGMSMFGYYCFAACTSALVYFTIMEIETKAPIMPIESSYVIPIIWSLITLKSGLFLTYYARKYMEPTETLLAEEVENESDNEISREITA